MVVAKDNPADSLPSHDSAKNMVWSAQQLSFLIEHGLMKDVAFCFRLQHLQCFCASNESNWQRSFFLCQHSQLCQSLACFHKQGLWTKFPPPLLAADVFLDPTPSSCCHEASSGVASQWRSKCNVRYSFTPPHPHVVTKQVSGVASQWRSKCNVRDYPTPLPPQIDGPANSPLAQKKQV